MDVKTMETAALEERKAAIAVEAEAADKTAEELNGLADELRAINTEIEERKAAEAERRRIAEEVDTGAGETTETIETLEERKMDNLEMRNTKQYIDAYAEYLKSGDDTECRALLTENVSGTVPVPEFVYDIVKTAWERDEITRRVRKSYLKGNVKIGFEISATGATKHTEAANSAVSEETLVLGIVELKPVSFKKWISISDEVYDMRGEEFLRYIYDELTYQIAKSVVNDLLDKITACTTTATTTQVRVGLIESSTISLGLVAEAMGKLSDEAANPIVVMNKATWSAFKAAQYAASYAVDPFEGLPVAFSNHLTAFSDATTGVPYAIIGDFGHGALANFPAGDGIEFKFDDMTLMEKDLIRILGRQYVGIEPVACDAFVKVAMPE